MLNLCEVRSFWVAAGMLIAPVLPGDAQDLAWVQLGEGNSVAARAIVEGGTCPTLTADGVALAMTVRADAGTRIGNVPPGADFEKATVCEVEVSPGTTALRWGDKVLPMPPRDIRRIVM